MNRCGSASPSVTPRITRPEMIDMMSSEIERSLLAPTSASSPQLLSAPDGGLDDLGHAGRVERAIHAPERGKAGDQVGWRRIDRFRCAELTGKLEPAANAVNGHDALAPDHPGSKQRREPSAPVPKIAKVISGRGLRTLRTVPAPVMNPQPSGPSRRNGASRRTLIALRAGAMACVANDD